MPGWKSFAGRLVGVAGVAAVVVSTQLIGPTSSSAASVPFTDPNSTGSITLCDVQGHEVTSGNINTVPFVWRAVGSTPAKSPYNATGRTAMLYATQPVQQITPDTWYGEALTASGKYTNAAHPMAAATPADMSLASYLSDYPTKWDGLVQLRIFLGAPQQAGYTASYDSATIKVDGDQWTLLQGGGGSCSSGTAVSAEMVLPSVASMPTAGLQGDASGSTRPKSTATTNAHGSSGPSADGTTHPSGGNATGSSSDSGSAGTSNAAPHAVESGSGSSNQTQAVSSSNSSSGGSGVIIGIVVAAVVIVAAAVGWLLWRKRSVANP
jgi:hypothetical protein